MFKKLALISFTLILLLSLLSRWSLAQSSFGLESRISRVEAENSQLRSQLNRLESQIYQVRGRSDGSRIPSRNPSSPATPRVNIPDVPTNPKTIVDRLAILVVELKQRVSKLEARVTKLEKPST